MIGLAWRRAHGQRALFVPTLVSAILMVTAHTVFWLLVQPANCTMAAWSLDSRALKAVARWEYSHAARAGLIIGALDALVFSVV